MLTLSNLALSTNYQGGAAPLLGAGELVRDFGPDLTAAIVKAMGPRLTASLVTEFGGHFTSQLVRAFGYPLTAGVRLFHDCRLQ